MRYQLLVWPLFAAIMGFALGGSVFWGLYGPNTSIRHVGHSDENHAANHEAKSKKEETDEALAYYTLWLMVFTGVLAAATLGLGGATFGLFLTGEKQIRHNAEVAAAQSRETRRSIAIAQKAAEAATLNARAAIGIELPSLRVEPLFFGPGATRGEDGEMRYHFTVGKIAVSNTGRTKAIPIELDCGSTFGEALPPEPVYGWLTGFAVDVAIEPAEPIEFWVHEFQTDVPADAIEQLKDGKAKYWFYIRLTYLDFMGERREHSFCWRRNESRFSQGAFYIDNTPAYNRKT